MNNTYYFIYLVYLFLCIGIFDRCIGGVLSLTIYEDIICTSIYKPSAAGWLDVFQYDPRRCIFYDFTGK